jgi:hypothetical protein
MTFSAKHLRRRDLFFAIVETNVLPELIHSALLSHARLFEREARMIPQAQASIEESRRLIGAAEQLLNRR